MKKKALTRIFNSSSTGIVRTGKTNWLISELEKITKYLIFLSVEYERKVFTYTFLLLERMEILEYSQKLQAELKHIC